LNAFDFWAGVSADVLRVELVERRVVFDGGIAAGLGDGGVVDLAVAVAAIAEEVDDDIGVEAMAEFRSDSRDADDCVGVLGIDVEDGNWEALGDVGGEARGVGLLGNRGEAEQVIDDDVDGAADLEAGERSEDQAFGQDSLAGEGGVSVHDDGEDLVAAGLVGAIRIARRLADAGLFGARAAEGDGIDRLEMAGVGDEVQGDGAAVGGAVLAGCAHVVLDVATAKDAARVDVLEAREDLGG
jgi:hypothetical protein